eukprot:1157586-Pelagomonas_calceolata.AAC.11
MAQSKDGEQQSHAQAMLRFCLMGSFVVWHSQKANEQEKKDCVSYKAACIEERRDILLLSSAARSTVHARASPCFLEEVHCPCVEVGFGRPAYLLPDDSQNVHMTLEHCAPLLQAQLIPEHPLFLGVPQS